MLSALGKRSAAGGVIVWLITLLLTTSDSEQAELVHKVVFWAVLVIVPLGLSVVAEERGLYKLVVLAQPVAALFTVASFFVQKGVLSAALASAWLILNVLIALLGLVRLTRRGFHRIEELSIDGGLLYLPVAGAWLVIYRLGVQPFDYCEIIILCTVVHFHF